MGIGLWQTSRWLLAPAMLLALSNGAMAATITSLTDNFTAGIDPTKWAAPLSATGQFEAGTANFNITAPGGQLNIAATGTIDFWGGGIYQSLNSFASNQATLITVDRVSQTGSGTAHRSALWLAQADGTYHMLSQNFGEGGWQINQNVSGTGSNIAALDGIDGSMGLHKLQFLYLPGSGNNATIHTLVGGVTVASNSFIGNWENGVDYNVRLAGLTRANGDTVNVNFDNFSAQPVSMQAATVTTNANNSGFLVSNTDLLQTAVTSSSFTGNINSEEGFTVGSLAPLTNGAFGTPAAQAGNMNEVVAIHNNTAITYELDTVANPQGYDISSIATYSGWNDGGRDDQQYTVLVELVDNPGVFLPLSAVDFGINNGNAPSDTSVLLNSPNLDPLAIGVSAIQFQFGATENGYVGYREFDVFGAPSAVAAVPEPASIAAFFVVAAVGCFAYRHVRRRAA